MSPAKRYHRGITALGGISGEGGLWPCIKERTPALTGAAPSFGLLPMSVPKFRPKLCFAITAACEKQRPDTMFFYF
jgi:hypothetical protein